MRGGGVGRLTVWAFGAGLLLAAGCAPNDAPGSTEDAGPVVPDNRPTTTMTPIDTTPAPSPPPPAATRAATATPSELLGIWIQDEAGPVMTYQRRFGFNADGSYEFLFTSRHSGAAEQTIVAHEQGRFFAEADRIVFSPVGGTSRTFGWRVEVDPYVGDTRLVLVLPDGVLDVYYRP